MYHPARSATDLSARLYRTEHGIALISSLMFLTVLALIGTSVTTITTLSSQISANHKAGMQSLQAAEAGAEEARARLRGNAVSPIVDASPTQTQWQTYIGSLAQAQAYGYVIDPNKTRVDSIQAGLQYTVLIAHATSNGGQILYWGDPAGTGTDIRNTITGQNIYLVTSYGTAAQARSTVQTQVARVPPIDIPGTVYVETNTTVQGSSSYIIGADQCGTKDRPGITTPKTDKEITITQNGKPKISGSPPIEYGGKKLNVEQIVKRYKKSADYSYDVQSATHTKNTTPGPGDNWGTPTAGATIHDASSCSSFKTVYYNTNNTY